MHRWVVVVAALVAATCVSIPPYQPDIAVRWDDSTSSIRGSNFTMQFAPARFRFPISLSVNGTELVGSMPGTAQCNAEDQVGVAFWPEPRASEQGSALGATDGLDAVMYGPAAVKLNHRWSSHFMCGSVDRTFEGFGSITAFPDGTIVRYDRLNDGNSSNTSITTNGCECLGAQPDNVWHVTTFWTFTQSRFDRLEIDGSAGSNGFDGTATDSLCLHGSGPSSVTFAKRFPQAPELRTARPITGQTVALVQDMISQSTLPMLGSAGTATNGSAQTALFVGSDCRSADAHRWSDATNDVMLNDNAVPLANDGIYGGDDDGLAGGFGVFTLPAVLRGHTTASFAVWLQFESPASSLRISRDRHSSGTWYIPQQLGEDKTNWLIWFKDGFADDADVITIEPQAP